MQGEGQPGDASANKFENGDKSEEDFNSNLVELTFA